jgi:formylglycine-generating enzyme required for sulfatase activity
MKCNKCNNENPIGIKFCVECGNLINETFQIDEIHEKVLKKNQFVKDHDMVLVESGSFYMGKSVVRDSFWDSLFLGDTGDSPVHYVKLNKFHICRHLITNEQFCKFINDAGNQVDNGKLWLDIHSNDCKIQFMEGKHMPYQGYEQHPVTNVTWYGAKAYSKWSGGRLPSEAEWEFAARGGNMSNGFEYSGSDELNKIAWYDWKNELIETKAVCLKKENELGIFDMSGNVSEWCNDWYNQKYYSSSPSIDPPGPLNGKYKIVRGGSFSSPKSHCRVFFRMHSNPHNNFNDRGFRIVED